MRKYNIVIKNLNKEKIINNIKSNVYDIKITNNKISFNFNNKNKKTVKKYLKNNNIEILQENSIGLFNRFLTIFKRIGIISAIFLSSIFFIISNNLIINVKILGLSKTDKNEVMAVINASGFKKYNLKSKTNEDYIQSEIQKIKNVSLVSVVVKGNTLVVNIKEKLYNEEYEEKDNFKPITAQYDGKITEMLIIQGTSKVEVGKFVKKGQVLVEPYIIDSSGNKSFVMPMADIKAEIFISHTDTIPDSEIVMQDTGNITTLKYLSFLDKPIYTNNGKCLYKYYRTEESSKYIFNGLLPIKKVNVNYIEQKQILKNNDFLNNLSLYQERVKQNAYSKVEQFDDITDEYCYYESSAGINKITYTYVVNKSII